MHHHHHNRKHQIAKAQCSSLFINLFTALFTELITALFTDLITALFTSCFNCYNMLLHNDSDITGQDMDQKKFLATDKSHIFGKSRYELVLVFMTMFLTYMCIRK